MIPPPDAGGASLILISCLTFHGSTAMAGRSGHGLRTAGLRQVGG